MNEKVKKYMKAANFNYGRVDGPFFPCCYLTSELDENKQIIMLIIGTETGEYYFRHEDVKVVKAIASGQTWIKWYMKFKDGKIAIVTSPVRDPNENNSGMAPFERFFGDLLFKEPKHCPDCGAEIDDDMAFCGECGRKL